MNRLTSASFALILLALACNLGQAAPSLITEPTPPTEPAPVTQPAPPPSTPSVTSVTQSVATSVAPPPSSPLAWQPTGLLAAAGGDVYNVGELLVDHDGRTVYAAYYDSQGEAYFARTSDGGRTWAITPLPEVEQVKALVQLSDGALVIGVSPRGRAPLLWLSRDGGGSWEALATGTLPNRTSAIAWDIVEMPDRSIVVATDWLGNDPLAMNATVYRSTDGGATFQPLAPLPGLGVLCLAVDGQGTLFAGVEESAEHDDPELAGQAHVYRSTDGGQSWQETGALDGANRVYRLYVKRDGVTLLAGTGIRGEFYRSTDRGASWEKMTHVPTTTRMLGNPRQPTAVDATRVYSVLELQDGRVLVGTGNNAGAIFVTADDGRTWQATGETGKNIVVWGLAQSADGTIWAGTGSYGGEVLTAKP